MKQSFSSSTFRNPIVLMLCTFILFFLTFSGLPISSSSINSLTTVEASNPEIGEPKPAEPSSVVRTSAPKSNNSMAALFAPVITATKSDSPASVSPGGTITYTVVISSSGMDATGVLFTDTIDANTTLVGGSLRATPIAVNDSFSAIGNVRIQVPAANGVLANDFQGIPTATISPTGNFTSTNNGNVTLNADGSFSYNPPPGFEGTDTFTYTLTNSAGSNNATVSITINGMIWFINNNPAAPGGAPGDGRLTNPFKLLSTFATVNNGTGNNPAANDNIFIYREVATDYSATLTLLNGQKLIGQGAGASLSTITGLTPPSFSDPLPATGGTNPNITSTGVAITLASGNLIRGLNVGDTATTDISGTNFGTLNIGEVALTGTGQALNLTTGTLSGPTASTASFTSISSTNSPTTGVSLTSVSGNMTSGSTTITNPTGIGLSVNTSAATLNFGNTTANQSGGAGVSLTTNTGPITFADLDIAPDANQKGLLATDNTTTITATSGTISTSTANAATNAAGVEITRASGTTPLAIALTSVSASGGTNGIILSNTSGSFTVNGDGANTAVGGNSTGGTISNKSGADGAVAGNGIYLSNATNVTLRRMTINGTNQNHGIRGINSSNFTLEFSTVSGTNGNSQALDEGSINFDNLLGAAAITSCLIEGGFEDNLNVVNTSGTLNRLTVSGSTFGFNNTANGNNNILIESQNAGTTLNFTLKSSLIKGARADWINISNNSNSTGDTVIGGPLVADGNNFDNLGANAHPGAAAGGNRVVFGGVGNSTVDIRNNTTKGSKGEAIRVRATEVAGIVGTVNARVRNNTVGVQGTANSGSSEGSGIFCFSDGGGKLTIAITDNQVFQYNNHGIRLDFGDEIVNGSINNATVTGNTVSNPGNLLTDFNGFHLNNGTVAATDDFTTCLHLSGNTLTGSGSGTISPNNQEFRLRQRQSTTVRLPGYAGGNTDTTAVVNFIRGQNTVTAGNGAASVQVPPGGGFIGGAACTSPSFALVDSQGLLSKVETNDSAIENPDGESGLWAERGEAKQNDTIHKLKQSELEWLIPAAIERWRQAGIAAEDLARLQNVRFELADLPEGEIARVEGEVVKIDDLAAGYGWFVDLTFLDDNEFTVGVPERELQTTDTSLAHGKMDLLTVVMRELGVEYLKGRTKVPKKLRPLMEATLSPSVRRVPNAATIDFIIPEATSDDGSGNLQASEQIKLEPTSSNASTTNDQHPLGKSQQTVNQNAVNSPQSGETVNVGPIPVLPVGESVTITFQVTVDLTISPTDCDVSNQGTVSGSNFSNVLTDDPAVGGAADPTLTTVVQPIVLSACPANITGNTDPNQCSRVVTYTAPTATGCPPPTVTCVPASGSAFPKGTTTVTCTASNGVAPNQTCTFTVTVNDAQPPTITCPANITQGTDPNLCTAVVTFAPTVTDNCPGVTFVCPPASGATFPKGTTTVNCTASDTATPPNTANCSFTVTVNDTQPPALTCPANVTTNTDPGQCSAVVNYTTPTPTDNCPNPTVVCVPPSGTAFPKGTTTVTCTASDTATPPNTAQCTFTVTVNDTQPPALTCPANITQGTDPNVCTAVVNYTTPTATDNCPPTSITATCNPPSGSTFPKGTTTVTCTASDTATPPNTSTCTFTVTINDTQPPLLTCPANVTTNTSPNQCSAVVTYTTPTATDNCPPLSFAATCNPPSGSTFPKGTTTVTCMASDGTNTSQCTFTVTVNDTQPPAITCPSNISVISPDNNCVVVNYTTPTPTDNCPGATASCTPPSGTCFAVGTTTVTCTATDTATPPNTAQCTFTVQVIPCTITCPANVTVPNDPNQCGAIATYPAPTTSGSCGTVTCTPPSGSFFPKGTTTVNCSTQTGPGCSFTVTVNDTQPPTITCPTNITVPNDPGQCAAIVGFAPTVADNCPGVTFVCTPPAGSAFPKGTTTVNCTATDAMNNTASCSFTVTVNDTQPPVITCPANITQPASAGQCSAVVTYPNATAVDNCPGVGTPVCTPASGSTFNMGTTTVTCNVADAMGNTANCTFTVTVTDTQAPTVTCPANITQSTDPNQCQAVVNYTIPTGTDNCPLPPNAVVCAPAPGSVFQKGTTTVTCTVTDSSNLTGTCTFTVTVNDTQPPVISCPADVIQSTDPNLCQAVVNYANATATDNCPNVGTPSCNPPSGSVFQKGTTTVNCTVSDASGNSANCSFTVTVNDTQPPVITCPANITTNTDPGVCTAVVTYPDPTVTDNCPPAGGNIAPKKKNKPIGGAVFVPVCIPPSGATFNKGVTTVNCTVSDASGNTASCSFTVTVNDTQPPVLTCPANQVRSTDPNLCTAVVTYPAPTVTDNCPGAGTPSCNPPSGSVFVKGTTTVNCTVSDGMGNTANCSFTVTVNDTQAPNITCPANIIATIPSGNCVVVNYPAPVATDNCPGVTVNCVPPSGSCFGLGTTTVTCTATDTSGNTKSCSFVVTTFDVCIQDDSDPTGVLLFNSTTGDYLFCCGGTTFVGQGTVKKKGNNLTLIHNTTDRRLLANVTFGGTGLATLQSPPGTLRCTITDRDVTNNTCTCAAPTN